MYLRTNKNFYFLLPALAVGIDVDGRYFIELGFGMWAIGLGEKP